MFTLEEVLSHENQEAALAHFAAKRNVVGPDGMGTRDLATYWPANGERICEELRQGAYQMGVVRLFERLGSTGKKRQIASINAVDRMVERMLQQVMRLHFEPTFCECSYAYREGKGPLVAAMTARGYIERGYTWLCEIDLSNFFDEIPHDSLINNLSSRIEDEGVIDLLRKIIERFIEERSRITRMDRGIVQGSSVSPILSNVFMHPFDIRLESSDMPCIRFADNIYLFAQSEAEAAGAYNSLANVIENQLSLRINTRKSGVFKAIDRRMLGYDFRKTQSGKIDLRKHSYQPRAKNRTWHQSVTFEDGREIHIVQDGVLNKQDYSLLFENDEEKHHIPVEVVEQLNIYGDVCVSPAAIRTLDAHNIKLSYFDKYGNLSGVYTPAEHDRVAKTFLKQCELYGDAHRRLELARAMEDASLSNMCAVLHYYLHRKDSDELREAARVIAEARRSLLDAESVEALMLIEAHARKAYYSSFDYLVEGTGFRFGSRSKRPPKNEMNALISFGNTVLYNKILQRIWKTSLDPKIGVVHATNRRAHSLNLDFADLFKPVVVDRTILSLVRRREIKTDVHFQHEADGGVLLNAEGKRLFIAALERKLGSSTKRRGGEKTYSRLISDEIDAFRRMVLNGDRYKPYKHY